MRQTITILFLSLIISRGAGAQNVGINSTGAAPNASAMLDVSATDRGILIPRVSLTATNTATPVSSPATGLTVFNLATAGSGSNAVSPGYYYWDGLQWMRLLQQDAAIWRVGGNTLSATGNFGTLSNNHIDIYTNNIVRGRFTNLGEMFLGTTNTTITGDLFGVVSNASFPFAVNGYSSFNGSGVYGAIQGGTTTFPAVIGDYSSNLVGANTVGVGGNNNSTTAGSGFRKVAISGPRVGVAGTTTSTNGQYTFGVHGSMGSTDIRCGGVIGDDFGIALGSLAYYAANLNDYSVYGFGRAYEPGVGTGRISRTVLSDPNTHIGLGIYGGVMGGWVRGLVYGAHMKGERYGLYVDGKTFTNAPVAELISTSDEKRVAAYGVSSLTADIYAKGKAVLTNGAFYVPFEKEYAQLIDADQVVVTVSPTTRSKGLYVEMDGERGFWVRENENSGAPVSFNWVAVASRKGQEAFAPSPELLQKDFDAKMDGVMFNDNNTKDKPGHLWWDGQEVRFDQPPPRKVEPSYVPTRQAASAKNQ